MTGASGGIGLELARELAANGFDLVLVARRRDKLQELADRIAAEHGVAAKVIAADLAEPSAPQAVFDAVAEAGLRIDVLVNNAGLLLEGRFGELPVEDEVRLVQVNVVALTALTRLFLGPMLERGEGRILNVASVAAFSPLPDFAIYAASKSYVLSFGDALHQELRSTKVTVTTLCPGATETALIEGTSLSKMPSAMIMDARTVAREGYRALMAGKAVHVPGMANEIATQWMKYQPTWLRHAFTSAFLRRP